MTVRGPTGYYWGGLPGLADGFEATRSTGWLPAVARMRVLRGDVTAWLLRQDPKRLEGLGKRATLPAIADALTEAAPRRFQPIPELPYRAPLFVVEQRGSERQRVAFGDFFLVEARVVDRTGEPAVIELVLADVRRFWRDYGELTKQANAIRGHADDGAVLYEQASLRGGTRPYLVSELLAEALANLPGEPELVGPHLRDRTSRPLHSWGGSPLEIAQALVQELRCVFAYHLDGSCSLEVPGLGTIGEAKNGAGRGNDTRCFEPATRSAIGAWSGEVPDATNLYDLRAPVDAPDEVLIVGPPPVQTVRVDYLEFVFPLEEPAGDGLPPVRRILSVTPDLIDQLLPSIGQAAANVERLTAPGAALAQTPAIDPFAKQNVQDQQAAAAAASSANETVRQSLGQSAATLDQLRATLIYKAPFFGSAWPEALGKLVPEPVREKLTRDLFRWVRLPAEFEQLLPILDRAEARNGKRLPAVVEAFTFSVTEVEITEADAEAGGITADERTLLEQQFADITTAIERFKRRLEDLTVTPPELAAAYNALMARAAEAAEIAKVNQVELAVGTTLVGAALLGAEWAVTGQPPAVVKAIGEVVQRIAGTNEIVEVFKTLAERWPAAAARLLKLPNVADLDPAGQEVTALKRNIATLEAERIKVAEKIRPAFAAEQKLIAATKAWSESAAKGGVGIGSEKAAADIRAAQAELAAARTATPHVAKKKQTVKRIVPQFRGPVPATIHVDEGLIELETAAVWPHDLGQGDLRGAIAMPLPVAITFGTWNLPKKSNVQRPELPAGAVTQQAILQASIDAFCTSDYLRDIHASNWGHVLPAQFGTGGPLRLTFNRTDRTSGAAKVGKWPFRITSASKKLQVLLPLRQAVTGTGEGAKVRPSNRPDVVQAAAEVADDAMLGQVRESGSILVMGPRPVNCDGRVTAVRWVSDAAGNVDTVIYLDPDLEPIADLATDELERDPEDPLTFGIDPESVQ